MNNVIFPEFLYHGTTTHFLDLLVVSKKPLINSKYWKTERDFGKGFYTTFDLPQAKSWANNGYYTLDDKWRWVRNDV